MCQTPYKVLGHLGELDMVATFKKLKVNCREDTFINKSIIDFMIQVYIEYS